MWLKLLAKASELKWQHWSISDFIFIWLFFGCLFFRSLVLGLECLSQARQWWDISSVDFCFLPCPIQRPWLRTGFYSYCDLLDKNKEEEKFATTRYHSKSEVGHWMLDILCFSGNWTIFCKSVLKVSTPNTALLSSSLRLLGISTTTFCIAWAFTETCLALVHLACALL